MRESRLSGSEGGVAPMGHPYPYGSRDARRYERKVQDRVWRPKRRIGVGAKGDSRELKMRLEGTSRPGRGIEEV